MVCCDRPSGRNPPLSVEQLECCARLSENRIASQPVASLVPMQPDRLGRCRPVDKSPPIDDASGCDESPGYTGPDRFLPTKRRELQRQGLLVADRERSRSTNDDGSVARFWRQPIPWSAFQTHRAIRIAQCFCPRGSGRSVPGKPGGRESRGRYCNHRLQSAGDFESAVRSWSNRARESIHPFRASPRERYSSTCFGLSSKTKRRFVRNRPVGRAATRARRKPPCPPGSYSPSYARCIGSLSATIAPKFTIAGLRANSY